MSIDYKLTRERCYCRLNKSKSVDSINVLYKYSFDKNFDLNSTSKNNKRNNNSFDSKANNNTKLMNKIYKLSYFKNHNCLYVNLINSNKIFFKNNYKLYFNKTKNNKLINKKFIKRCYIYNKLSKKFSIHKNKIYNFNKSSSKFNHLFSIKKLKNKFTSLVSQNLKPNILNSFIKINNNNFRIYKYYLKVNINIKNKNIYFFNNLNKILKKYLIFYINVIGNDIRILYIKLCKNILKNFNKLYNISVTNIKKDLINNSCILKFENSDKSFKEFKKIDFLSNTLLNKDKNVLNNINNISIINTIENTEEYKLIYNSYTINNFNKSNNLNNSIINIKKDSNSESIDNVICNTINHNENLIYSRNNSPKSIKINNIIKDTYCLLRNKNLSIFFMNNINRLYPKNIDILLNKVINILIHLFFNFYVYFK